MILLVDMLQQTVICLLQLVIHITMSDVEVEVEVFLLRCIICVLDMKI